MSENKEIKIVRIRNPFDPRDRVYESMPFVEGNSMLDYFPVINSPSVLSLNGKVIDEEDYRITIPEEEYQSIMQELEALRYIAHLVDLLVRGELYHFGSLKPIINDYKSKFQGDGE